jgi:hypothetical protein
MNMINRQKLSLIPLDQAPADNISYLGIAFNTLSNSIDNLLRIFTKFTNQDIVEKAYEEEHIDLGGEHPDGHFKIPHLWPGQNPPPREVSYPLGERAS